MSARSDCRPYDRVTARSWPPRRFPRTLLTWQWLTDLAAFSRETLRTVAAIAVTFLQTAPSVETGVSLARVLLHCKQKQSGTLLNVWCQSVMEKHPKPSPWYAVKGNEFESCLLIFHPFAAVCHRWRLSWPSTWCPVMHNCTATWRW